MTKVSKDCQNLVAAYQNLEKQSLTLVSNYSNFFFQLSFSASNTLISAHKAYATNSTKFKSITTNLSYEDFAEKYSCSSFTSNVI